MPEMPTLEVEPRAVLGKKVKALRRAGVVPGVVYGHRSDPIQVQIDEPTLVRFLSSLSASSLIQVSVQGEPETRPALIRDVQWHTITRRVSHVDFLQVSMTERVRVDVPIVLHGVSPATSDEAVIEAEDGSISRPALSHLLDMLSIECLPSEIPSEISLDVSVLKEVNDAITVADLDLGEDIVIHTAPDHVIVRVSLDRVAVEEEEVEEELGEVEVISSVEAEARAREREEEDD